MKRVHVLLIVLGVFVIALSFRHHVRNVVTPIMHRLRPHYSVEDRVRQYGPHARARLAPWFARAGVAYPPSRVVLLGIKDESELQVYAAGKDGVYHFIHTYPILAASGVLGPKLREGDFQVPEGIYRVDSLNPNGAYHLALRVNYPNAFDREMARREGRTELGGDIMIHGSNCSVGCLAMGDPASEDLFILAHDTGLAGVTILLTPVDFRTRTLQKKPSQPAWVHTMYRQLADTVKSLPAPRS